LLTRSVTKILYIEDTENNRILITRRLAQNQYKVITAENAAQGMALARAEMPALILMDMGLPDVDGWSATRQFKEDPQLKHIPILALTAHVMHGDREKALAAGCDDYDTKPFHFVRLISKIEALLAGGASEPNGNAGGEMMG
jgi:CheY-like chemotaxis protein